MRKAALPWNDLQEAMSNAVYIFGASGHAKVIIEILKSHQRTIAGIFDDNPNVKNLWEYPVTQLASAKADDCFIVAIGNNRIREKVVARLAAAFSTAFHPSSNISPTAQLGVGTVVMAGASINADARIGAHCIINTNASVDHDCVVEDFVHISPNAALCGNVKVGRGAHVGAGAVILPGITIGEWAVVGAGAVVTKPVPAETVVAGNPARIK